MSDDKARPWELLADFRTWRATERARLADLAEQAAAEKISYGKYDEAVFDMHEQHWDWTERVLAALPATYSEPELGAATDEELDAVVERVNSERYRRIEQQLVAAVRQVLADDTDLVPDDQVTD